MSTFKNITTGILLVSGPDVFAEVEPQGTVQVPDSADADMASQPHLWQPVKAAKTTTDAAAAA